MAWLSPTSWMRVVLATVAGTIFCIAVALYVDSFNFHNLSEAALRRAIMVDVLVPTFLAGPLLFLVMYQMRQLAIAHHELQIVAATDSLTKVLNRGAFTMLVEAYLAKAEQQVRLRSGALLVIDADHFKSINDHFEHDNGDKALKIIAQSIQGALREADLVGRIGGEEFGVFLPGAGTDEAKLVAERIRYAVSVAEFNASGRALSLSVSVGGALFAGPASFDALYVAADDCLYGAKSAGRNRVELCPISSGSAGHQSAARRGRTAWYRSRSGLNRNPPSDGVNPSRWPTPSPGTEKVSGAGPAIAEHTKDAKAPRAGRQPGAYRKS